MILGDKAFTSKKGKDIEFLVERGSSVVGSKRHINVQGRHVSLPTLTENDWKDIDFGIEKKVDMFDGSKKIGYIEVLRIHYF